MGVFKFYSLVLGNNYPVFVASHGKGSWEPEKISCSINDFCSSLLLLEEYSKVYFFYKKNHNIKIRKILEDTKIKVAKFNNVKSSYWSILFELFEDYIDEFEDGLLD